MLVLDARPQLGGRATAFTDRVTGELVDNGQHVLFGCYHETFAFLRRIGAEGNVRVQPSLRCRTSICDGRRSVLRCPPLPAPLHLLGGVLDWDALPLARPAVGRCGWPGRCWPRARRSRATRRPCSRRSGDGVRVAGAAGQGRRLREWLWEPLAVAALNQSPDEAAAAPFVARAGRDVRPRRVGLRACAAGASAPRDVRRAGARFIARAAARCGPNALARVSRRRRPASPASTCAASGSAPAPVIAAVPWFGAGRAVRRRRRRPLAPIVAQRVGDGVEADRDGEPLVRPRRSWTTRSSACRARRCSGCSTSAASFGELRARRTCRSCRAAPTRSSRTSTTALIALAAREVADALPGARGARLRPRDGRSARSARRSRWRPASRRVPARARRSRGLFLAGDWIDTGLPGTIESAVVSGHGRRPRGSLIEDRATESRTESVANRRPSAIVTRPCEHNAVDSRHEIRHRPLPGDRAQGEEPAVVRRAAGAQPARGDARASTSTTCASLMGRIEIVLGPAADVGRSCAIGCRRVFGVANFARAGRAPLDIDAIAAAILDGPRARGSADVPRVGAPRRQALPADVAARSSARSAAGSRGARLARRSRRARS